MNYEGAPGLEFGTRNSKIDPSVMKCELEFPSISEYSISDDTFTQVYLKAARFCQLKAMESAFGRMLDA
jgi:hypothetical protein